MLKNMYKKQTNITSMWLIFQLEQIHNVTEMYNVFILTALTSPDSKTLSTSDDRTVQLSAS